jgi:Cu+-exporting ATPase
MVLDKTGTITRGEPAVTDVISLTMSDDALFEIAGRAELPSEHPFAKAIVRSAQERGITLARAEGFSALPGQGLQANVGGRRIEIGNEVFMRARSIDSTAIPTEIEALAEKGSTPVIVAVDGLVAGAFGIADEVRPESASAVAALRRMGIDLIMLTGDNRRTAMAVAAKVGITDVRADVLPAEKAAVVESLQAGGKLVAMVGDGINDAPALAQADVGIAVGTGTDVAIEAADMTLLRGDLRRVVTALQLSKATIATVKQNLFWAFVYNVIGIPIAAGILYPVTGWLLSPVIASAAMSLSSVSVLTNSLRLRSFQAPTV